MNSTKNTIFSFLLSILFLCIGSLHSTFAQDNLVINFTSMSPHINQTLYLRVEDKGTMKEVGRTSEQILSSAFSITLPVLEVAHSYFVDFFADFNSNGLYDAPPTDHAWRLELNNAKTGGDTLNFTHNTNFTDIAWPYVLTVNFSGMTPHIGQLLELKVQDNNTNEEVGRIKVPSIPSADFQVQVVGLKLNTQYKVQFYADLNKNGIYDSPPTDHAWEISFTNPSGDTTVDFTHNTTFTDINWKYLLTVNLISMNPHLGQLFQLRVVQQDNQMEIGRYTLPQILVPNFSVYIPGFELGHNYNIDFYADFNGNQQYDSPPTDHAWRLSFSSDTGNVVEDFTHNTNFTDIQWPGATGISEEEGLTPGKYILEQNFPNPFNPLTTINFSISQKSFVNLRVFNIIGEEVSTLLNEEKDAGSYHIKFNALNVPSGIYFYKIIAGNFSATRKMILIK
jgi:Secretion system C-terminal sorting domain